MFEDEDAPSPSSADYLESPHDAKRKALMRQLEKKGIKDDVKSAADIQQLKLTLLRGQMSKKDEKPKNEPPDKGATSGTKTREQEIAASKLTADTKPSAQQLVDLGVQDEKAEEQLQADEVQSEDA